MEAEMNEVGKAAMAELDRIEGVKLDATPEAYVFVVKYYAPEPEPPLRILPADEPPKKEASTFGVLLGLLTIGFTVLTLAGMKLFDIFWRMTR